MKAKLGKQKSNARNYGGEKEKIRQFSGIVRTKNGIAEIVDCRCYMGRSSSASVVYASIWIHDRVHNYWSSGRGTAGGYGYDKQSAAIGDAISNANVKLDQDIHGVGELAVEEAITAIIRALGYEGQVLVLIN